jgi:hypothetical protein
MTHRTFIPHAPDIIFLKIISLSSHALIAPSMARPAFLSTTTVISRTILVLAQRDQSLIIDTPAGMHPLWNSSRSQRSIGSFNWTFRSSLDGSIDPILCRSPVPQLALRLVGDGLVGTGRAFWSHAKPWLRTWDGLGVRGLKSNGRRWK